MVATPGIQRAAAAALLLALAACGEQVWLAGDVAPSVVACTGLPCGAPCLPASCPFDGGPCDVTRVRGTCDVTGTCVTAPPMCPMPMPCDGKHCGDPCMPCDPMMPGCGPPPMPMACDDHGMCVDAMQAECMPHYDPCHDKHCGDMCMACDPDNPECMEPPGPKACDPTGTCVLAPVMCPP
jgi:hypothetical protein